MENFCESIVLINIFCVNKKHFLLDLVVFKFRIVTCISLRGRLCSAVTETAVIQGAVLGHAVLAMLSQIANTNVLKVQEDKFRFSCVKLQ